MMWGWEHAGQAGRDIPWGLGEESSDHAIQLGRHSDDDLGLVRWSASSISTSPKVAPTCHLNYSTAVDNFCGNDTPLNHLTTQPLNSR